MQLLLEFGVFYLHLFHLFALLQSFLHERLVGFSQPPVLFLQILDGVDNVLLTRHLPALLHLLPLLARTPAPVVAALDVLTLPPPDVLLPLARGFCLCYS